MIKVDDKLIRGKAVTSPYRLYTMKQNNITQIIDLRNTSYIKKYIEKFFCKLFGIKYVNIKYSHRLDNLPEENLFQQVVNAITGNPKQTYMHCEKGKRRAGIIAAYYEKKSLNKSNEEVIDNLMNNGFSNLNIHTPKGKKYIGILTEFIDTYLHPKSI